MALSDLDRHRQTPLDPKTADRLAREFSFLRRAISNLRRSIRRFERNDQSVPGHRGGRSTRFATWVCVRTQPGTLQSLVGLWQIFSRQASIAPADQDRTLAAILTRFAKVKNEGDVFDGGRDGIQTLLAAAGSPAGASAQDRMLDLLAGTVAARHLRHAQPIGRRYDSDLRGAAADLAGFDLRSGGSIGERGARGEGQ